MTEFSPAQSPPLVKIPIFMGKPPLTIYFRPEGADVTDVMPDRSFSYLLYHRCALPSIRFLFFCEKKYIIFACRPPPPLFAAPLPAFLAKAKRRRCSAPLFPRTGGAPFFTCRTSLWKSSSLPLPWRSFYPAQIYSARLCSAPAWPADFARCCFSSLFSFTIDRMVRVFQQTPASPCTAGTPATPLW